jgi:L-alanine-DL-glutamate epimerase-like enolase superfamily enzyme
MLLVRRRQFLLASASATAAAADSPVLTRFELRSVRVPFAARVREAWMSSWKNQKRDQNDYVLHFVTLHSGDGLTGIGETKMPREQAEARLRAMMGKPAAAFLHDDSLRGILIAVYDLAARHAGVPVAKLLNPAAKPKIVPTWWSQCFPPALMASEARLGYSLGYRVHKVKARPWEDPVAQAGAICDAIGKDMKVWVDANSTWETVGKTIEVTRELARFANYFAIESPIPRQNLDGYRALRGKLPLRISEHVDGVALELWTREKLLDAWIVGAPKLGQYVRGFSDRAAAAKTPIWIEHSIDNGVAQVFQAHQVAAYRGLEYSIAITHVLEDDCMKEPFTVRNGYYEIPRKPGLGVSFDEAAIDRYRLA